MANEEDLNTLETRDKLGNSGHEEFKAVSVVAAPADQQKQSLALNPKLQCRMYEDKFPEVETLVMVNVRQIAEMGGI